MQKSLPQQKKPVFIIAIAIFVAVCIAWVVAIGVGKSLAHATEVRPEPNFVRSGEEISIPAQSALRDRIVVQAVEALGSDHTLALPAQVEADPARTVNIVPPVAGKVLELKVGLGDHVKKGQLLLVLTSGDFAQATADQQKARDALQLANKVLERQRGVQDAGAGAAKDLEQAESAHIQAQSEFTRADTRVKSLSAATNGSAASNGQRLNIVAPTSGSITALAVGVGQSLNDPTAVLMTIANLDSVWVTANVPENMLASVKNGQSVAIRFPAYPDNAFQGKVAFISDVLQPDTRRAAVRISMPNADGKLKPNMFATAAFSVVQAAAPTVPTSALLMNNDDTTVFLELTPWTFVRRKVTIGSEDDGSVRIQSGLKLGDRVVTKGGVLLND
ncbi:efflux RND transporter periplasmic adaptor subunit [Glaciimonas sp. PCH181]|uniref:efflux RND transporter periplasmic adaptor subunit n=1 Tax=Glaciimonas sp. PCH181 TaxID=2133943 RepID=UPI000D3A961A|nr:efflux RND transporter periplasmic adaptor subunit [Glaciimonas sp. PCH181]PUA20005.1 efflux RND transporter periplasmic adaptor subunit [Glaciimonas sp. PCH181]